MICTGLEISKIKFLLPVQSDLETIRTVAGILNKIADVKVTESEISIILTHAEIELLKNTISILDETKSIHYECLSLIEKILKEN